MSRTAAPIVRFALKDMAFGHDFCILSTELARVLPEP